MAGFSVEGIHFSLAYSDYVDRELVDTTEVIFVSADTDPPKTDYHRRLKISHFLCPVRNIMPPTEKPSRTV